MMSMNTDAGNPMKGIQGTHLFNNGKKLIYLMWNSSLYAVNMLYYHWLIKKLLQPMAVQNRARQEQRLERVGRVKGIPRSY